MKRLFFAFLFAGFIFSASAQDVNDFEYSVNSNNITITGYKGKLKEVTIPKNINGMPVTAIGASAFLRKRLTSLVLPDTLTTIEDYAFSYNNLSVLTLPDSVVYIGLKTFSNNRLTSLTLSNSLSHIGMFAFSDNRLKTMNLVYSLTYIGDGAFIRNYLDSVSVPKSIKNFNSMAFDSYVKVSWY